MGSFSYKCCAVVPSNSCPQIWSFSFVFVTICMGLSSCAPLLHVDYKAKTTLTSSWDLYLYDPGLQPPLMKKCFFNLSLEARFVFQLLNFIWIVFTISLPGYPTGCSHCAFYARLTVQYPSYWFQSLK